MESYSKITAKLEHAPACWLVTGVAGFIGSNIAQTLLGLNQNVIGLDNFSSGKKENIENIISSDRFTMIEGDIRDSGICEKACKDVDFVLHHAAIGSVVKCMEVPDLAEQVNVQGFVNILEAAKTSGVKKVIYASTSAVYGNGEEYPRRENEQIVPASPYPATKFQNEKDAAKSGVPTVGLRYFNVYGPRQDPQGAYAAVIPRWITEMVSGKQVEIFGDGNTKRDFCYISDIVAANIVASQTAPAENQVYNIASGRPTSLNQLFDTVKAVTAYDRTPVYKAERIADIKFSVADTTLAAREMGFIAETDLDTGLKKTLDWYMEGHR